MQHCGKNPFVHYLCIACVWRFLGYNQKYGTNISTEEKKEKTYTRVFKARAIPGREKHASEKKGKETEAIKRLNVPPAPLTITTQSRGARGAAIFISKKAIRNASARNLIKRRIRAILQPLPPRITNKLVVRVRQGAAPLSFQELKKELLKGMEKNNIVI